MISEGQMKRLDWIISSLERVLANGHGMIPVQAADLRILIEAARAGDMSKAAEKNPLDCDHKRLGSRERGLGYKCLDCGCYI